MRSCCRLLFLVVFLVNFSSSFAARAACDEPPFIPSCDKKTCCGNMGGISYCDSSGGRYVCNNGFYSSCYCTRHAVMDIQKIQGCCLWQGGVLSVEPTGLVICNNGGVSETCSLELLNTQPVSNW